MDISDIVEEFYSGRAIMYLLGICSILSLAAILERAFAVRRRRILGGMPGVLNEAGTPAGNQNVRDRCAGDRSLLGRIVKVVFESNGSRELTESAGRAILDSLDRRIVLLEVIAVVSPLLGLLGTVLGLNQVFEAISIEGLGNVKAFSQGIALALRTTIFGLAVAIPSSVASMFFDRKVERLSRETEYWATLAFERLWHSASVRIEGAEHGTEGETSETAVSS